MRSEILKWSSSLLVRQAELTFSQFRWLRRNGIISASTSQSWLAGKMVSKNPHSLLCCRKNIRHYSWWSASLEGVTVIKKKFTVLNLGHPMLHANCSEISRCSGSRLMSEFRKSDIDTIGLERVKKEPDVVPPWDDEALTDLQKSRTEMLTVFDEVPQSVDVGIEDRSLQEMSHTVYNLAPYVEKSVTLKKLIRLGVDLSKVEKVRGIASLLVMSDFDIDILPYLQHLVRIGVQPDKLGHILSVNPLILTEYIQHLEQRVGYLVSKDFLLEEVASMYSRAPVMIQMDPVRLDAKFGYLRQAFHLSALELRQVAMTFPKIVPWKKEKIKNIRFQLKEFMGFDDDELKEMIIKQPKLFASDVNNIQRAFDYVHNTMLIPHTLVVRWPGVLKTRLHIIRSRHLFLVHLGKAQYDPCRENYVSMKAMLACVDTVFCESVARSTLDEYYSFLKTM